MLLRLGCLLLQILSSFEACYSPADEACSNPAIRRACHSPADKTACHSPAAQYCQSMCSCAIQQTCTALDPAKCCLHEAWTQGLPLMTFALLCCGPIVWTLTARCEITGDKLASQLAQVLIQLSFEAQRSAVSLSPYLAGMRRLSADSPAILEPFLPSLGFLTTAASRSCIIAWCEWVCTRILQISSTVYLLLSSSLSENAFSACESC